MVIFFVGTQILISQTTEWCPVKGSIVGRTRESDSYISHSFLLILHGVNIGLDVNSSRLFEALSLEKE